MITKLEQLTMSQFIDLACGDTSVLLYKHEIVSPAKVAESVRNIIYEYRCIVDKASAKSYLSECHELIKANAGVVLFKMCQNLVAIREFGRVREIMDEYGINAGSMSDQRVKAEVKSRLERAKSMVEKLSKESEESKHDMSEIRASFDEQTAALMAHYKFQIDTSTMRATLYAQLVARCNREVKAQMAAMKKNKIS